jgi:hypothetical protein
MADPLPFDPTGSRLVMIPDTDGDLADALGLLEEVLLHLQPHEPGDEPAPPGLGELHALGRVAMRVYAAEQADDTPALYAPDGGLEYLPLRFVTLRGEDLDAVGTAIAALGAALLPGGDNHAVDALANFVQQGRQTPQDLIVRFAQAHAVLDLAVDNDMILLAHTLTDKTGRVVLTPDQDQAYRRYTDRVLALNFNDPLDRYLYRGL